MRKRHLDIENYGVLNISLLTHQNHVFQHKLRHPRLPYPEYVFPPPVSRELSMFFPPPLASQTELSKFQFHPEVVKPLSDYAAGLVNQKHDPFPDLTDKHLYIWSGDDDKAIEQIEDKKGEQPVSRHVLAGVPSDYSPSQLFKESSLHFV